MCTVSGHRSGQEGLCLEVSRQQLRAHGVVDKMATNKPKQRQVSSCRSLADNTTQQGCRASKLAGKLGGGLCTVHTKFGVTRSSGDPATAESRCCEGDVVSCRKNGPTACRGAAALSSLVKMCTGVRCIVGGRTNSAGRSMASGSAKTDFCRECTLVHFQGAEQAETW